MDECPLCNTKCYVVNTRASTAGKAGNNAFVCIECLIRWPTGGGMWSRFTNSPMSKALPTF